MTRPLAEAGDVPLDRATNAKGPDHIYVAPAEAFPHYFEWYEAGSMAELRFHFTSKLREAMRQWRYQFEEALRAEGQTRARWEALFVIALSGQRSSQKSLANRLRIESPTLVRMLDKLERDGLIQRIPGPDDRRSKAIQPTAKGRALVDKLIRRTDTLRAELLAGWSEEEMKAGIALFDRLIGQTEAR